MGNRGKRGRRTSHANSRRGSTAAPARAYQSATPSKESSRRNLDFKISVNFHGQGAKATTGVPPPLVGSDERDEGAGDAEQHEQKDEEDKEHLPAVAPTRKSGRVIKKTWQEDFVFGSEMDEQIDCSPVRKADDEDNGVDYQSSPPQIFTLQESTRGRGRPRKNAAFQPSHNKVDDNDANSSSITFATPFPQLRHLTFQANNTVYEILNTLQGSPKTQIHLPDIDTAATPGVQLPYTATFLTHLYIVCYHTKHWHLCDLVADTWIRAFHTLRKKAERSGKEENMLWRPNSALASRGKKCFDVSAPDYKLSVQDPALDPNVTDFDNTALSELYNNTHPTCGARFLWADAMTLCGDKLEKMMVQMKRRGQTWHPDLLHNIACSSLRMVRRKLTLKIEEHTEGAYCKRYHEHTKHDLPCYRLLASGRKKEREVDSEIELDDGDLAALLEEGLDGGSKRGFGNVDDGGAEMSPAKRVRFGSADREVFDIDAEGESEED